MTYSLAWLADVLMGAGLKVAETDGWKDRGHGDVATIRGVMCHHTAGLPTRNMPTLNTLINGRAATPGAAALTGPVANLGLGRDGAYYAVAAGRAYHAGEGSWKGITSGNSSFVGIEAENVGGVTDAWPPVQLDAYHRGAAAILKRINADASWCCGHREYAPNRKDDPVFDMNPFRAAVQAILDGTAPAPALIAHADAAGRPTIRRGSTGDMVKTLQGAVGATPDGIFGADTETKVRIFQRLKGLVPDGIVGPATWAAIFPIAAPVP
ncbi:MAG TPA: N-acetylmuramoyl-L-alanine amidase [Caulobacteraceae bacterium]